MTSPTFTLLNTSAIQMTTDGSVWYMEAGTDTNGVPAARLAKFMF
jgi:hypothetical protein